MSSKSKITISSKHRPEFSCNISLEGVTYHVQTEDMGRKTSRIITNVYLKGEVVTSKKYDYSHLLKLTDADEKIASLMEKQHKAVIRDFSASISKENPTTSDYFSEIKQLLRRGNGKQALEIIREGMQKFPADPFLYSYYGCLIAIVENNPREGIKICEEAIRKLETSMPFGTEFFYPAFYLNLGRAYLKGNRKADAIKAFKKGLKSDPENNDLQWEMQKLGSRKKPVVPFLHRSNPINKYIGMLINKTTK